MKLTFIGIAFLLAGPAIAQHRNNMTRVDAGTENVVSDRAPKGHTLVYARAMAKCLWKKKPRQMAEILSATNAEDYTVRVERASSTIGACWRNSNRKGDNLPVSRQNLHGLIAERRFLNERVIVPNVNGYTREKDDLTWLPFSTEGQVSLKAANCLVNSNPEDVLAYLSIEAETSNADENDFSIFETSPCLPSDRSSFDRDTLRLALASELAWRLRAVEPRASSEAPGTTK